MNLDAAASKYLKAGPPFRGKSPGENWHDIREAGGDGARYEKETREWLAKTETAFVAMYETCKWIPTHCVNPDAVVRLIKLKQRERADNEMKKRTSAHAASKLTPEQQEAKRRQMNGIRADAPEELERLWKEYGVPAEKVRFSSMNPALGPWCGQSDAFRLLRGLNYKIVDVQAAVTGNYTIATKKQSVVKKRKSPSVDALDTLNTLTDPDITAHVASKAEDLFEVRAPWQSPSYRPVPIRFVKTRCRGCGQSIDDQFLDCDCTDAWSKCTICGYAFCAEQRCGCRTKKASSSSSYSKAI